MSRRSSLKHHHSDHFGHPGDSRLNYAAAGRWAAGYTLAHAGRQLRLGPIAFWVVVGTLGIMAGGALPTPPLFAFRGGELPPLLPLPGGTQIAHEEPRALCGRHG